MNPDDIADRWIVDFTRSTASRGKVLIRFSESAHGGLDITFVLGGDCSIEEQCLIAGEATEAIQTQRRWN